MHQLCAGCQAEYLKYLDELAQEFSPEQAKPTTLDEIESLSSWALDQFIAQAGALNVMMTRIEALERDAIALRAIASQTRKEAA
jgi:hypothetical protein